MQTRFKAAFGKRSRGTDLNGSIQGSICIRFVFEAEGVAVNTAKMLKEKRITLSTRRRHFDGGKSDHRAKLARSGGPLVPN